MAVVSQAPVLRRPVQQRFNRERVYPYLAILPIFLVIALFTLYPVIYSVWISLHKYLLTQPNSHPFVGLKNFNETITSYYFTNSLIITGTYAFFAVLGVIVFGLLVALFLNTRVRTASIVKILILLPWAIPAVTSGLLWKWLLNADFGALNGLLYSLGIIHNYIPFLATPELARVSLILAQVWKEGPLAAIFFLAGLQLIPKETYEAARIDGGSNWGIFRYITLPLLRPTLLVVLVYETMTAILTFDIIAVMTGGGPADGTALISWFAYAEIFKNLNLGHGSALAFVIALITLVLIFLYLRALRPEQE